MSLKFGSVCSGIEAASQAWESLGWQAVWLSEIDNFPSALLAHHYPTTPNLGDMGQIPNLLRVGKIEAPDVLVGGTPCFTAGHLVLTEYGFKPIEDVKPNDRVVTHLGRLQKVVRVGSKLAKVGLMKATGLPEPIVCTPDHPFLSVTWVNQNTRRNGLYARITSFNEDGWVKAKDMPDKQWCSLLQFTPTDVEFCSAKFSPEQMMYIAGMYVGDGYIRRFKGKNKKAVILCLNQEKLDKMIASVGDFTFSVSAKGKALKITFYDTVFADWLTEHFGELSHQKNLPAWILGHQLKHQFLQGYIDTDGCEHDGKKSFSTTSRTLAYGITALLNVCGEVASVKFVKTSDRTVIDGRSVNQRDYWQIQSFSSESSRKSRRYRDFLLRKVQAFEEAVDEQMVFNIEVEEDHSYILNNAIVHNCQSFSVAGLRKGIADARGALTLCFIEIANEIDTIRARKGQQPSLIVWENVPGVLSDANNAFGCFLAGLAGSDCELQPTGKRWTNAGVVFGPQRTVAWRILDAQYWGLAQRRKRVFVVASARAAFDPTQILFERDGLRRNPAPLRSAQQAVAATLEASIGRGRGAGTSAAVLVPDLLTFRKLSHGEFCEDQVSSTVLARDFKDAKDLVVAYGIAGNIIGRSPKNGGNGTGYCEDLGYTLTKTDQHGVAYAAFVQNSRDEVRYVGGDGAIVGALAASAGAKQQNYLLEKTDCLNLEQPQCWRVYSENGLAPTLQAGESRGNIILTVRLAVRRLMPVECERLQGFPDDYTQIPYRNKTEAECSDSPRYKALGNSMAVPVMAWLGLKIQNYLDRLSAQECAA